jgi:hypothetical protein
LHGFLSNKNRRIPIKIKFGGPPKPPKYSYIDRTSGPLLLLRFREVIFQFREVIFRFREVIFRFREVIFRFREVIFWFREVIFRFRPYLLV